MLKVDLHVHSVKSYDAFNTLHELALEASKRKMKMIGITDHGPDFPVKVDYYCWQGWRIPKYLFGVRVLFGIEASVTDDKGGLGIPETDLKKLTYVTAGYHPGGAYKDKGREGNTKSIINVMKLPYVKVITHPHLPSFDIDIEKIAEKACKMKMLLELNNCYLREERANAKPKIVEDAKKMIRVIQENDWKLIVGTDAHILNQVGDDCNVQRLKKQLCLKDKTVINNDLPALKEYFGVD